jgi:hypothetical protein
MTIKSSRRNRRQIPNSLAAVTAPVVDLWELKPIDSANPSQIPVVLYQIATTPEGNPAPLPVDPNTWLIGLTPEIGYITGDGSTFVPAIGTLLTVIEGQDGLAFVFPAPVPLDATFLIPSWSDSLRSLSGAWLAGGQAKVIPPEITVVIGDAVVDSSTVINVTFVDPSTSVTVNLVDVDTTCITVNGIQPQSITPIGPMPTANWAITMEFPIGLEGEEVRLKWESPCPGIVPSGGGTIGPFNMNIGNVP